MEKSLLNTLGNTPLVQYSENIWAKLEYFNPAGSIKDRTAFAILTKAQERGELNAHSIIIEATAGNMGVGLAFCAAIMGLSFIAIMPENVTKERKDLICAYGAKIILTPKELGMQGAVEAVQKLADNLRSQGKSVFLTKQFENFDNVLAHYEDTGEEIWQQTQGKIDILVAGIGSGGTISGVAKKLREKKPAIQIVGVEAKESPLLSQGYAGSHTILGISPNFVPKILHTDLIDRFIAVSSNEAREKAKKASQKGFLLGPSSGAALFAAKEIAKESPEAFIVTICADNGERYLSQT